MRQHLFDGDDYQDSGPPDPLVDAVFEAVLRLDPEGSRTAAVLRSTFDQLYDRQRTGRYRWDQLHKTEKTHCGTLVEINMQREFNFADGEVLDFRIAGTEVDCKYSQSLGGWMIPIEARGEICLVLTASDEASSWSMGVVRATEDRLTKGANRDLKASISKAGRSGIIWLFKDAELPPNALLHMPTAVIESILATKAGQQRINQLFRTTPGTRIGGNVVATIARQKDYMKRVRDARKQLRPEGIIILGQYQAHQRIATALGLPVPGRGESVSARVIPADPPRGVAIGETFWTLAGPDDTIVGAPDIPAQ